MHTRLVGAFDAIILSTTAIVMIVMLAALIDPSFGTSERLSRRGTVTIEQVG